MIGCLLCRFLRGLRRFSPLLQLLIEDVSDQLACRSEPIESLGSLFVCFTQRLACTQDQYTEIKRFRVKLVSDQKEIGGAMHPITPAKR